MSIYMTVFKCICMHEYMYVCMHVCSVCVYTCVHASMCICMYVYMYACVYTCMYNLYVILKLGFEREGRIVLVGRGNCPGNCPGEMSVPRCRRGEFWGERVTVSYKVLGGGVELPISHQY